MGFNKVYKSLQEIFPQVDARVLRAVAIEHSKDADAAVEAVLVEIIPFFSERSRPGTPLTGSISGGESSEAIVGAAAPAQTGDGPSVNPVVSSVGQNDYIMNSGKQHFRHDADGELHEPFYYSYHGYHEGEHETAELVLSEKIENGTQTNLEVHSNGETVVFEKNGLNTLLFEVSENPKTDGTVSADNCPGSSIKISSDDIHSHALVTLQDEGIEVNQNMNLVQECVDCDHLETKSGTSTNKESDQGKCSAYGNDSGFGPIISPIESTDQLVVQPDVHGTDLEESDVILPTKVASNTETTNNVISTEDESNLNTSISQSSQIHIMDVLEEIISDARNNKKTLFSAMETVMYLMREVELKEQAAEQAKAEAAMGGTGILVKLEELKQMVQRAKDANGMHAGEVYGEKAILATELRELQSRVLSLSDERDKSLAVLDEMCQTLEVRLAAAENEIKSAEQEKIEKEKAAMKALAEQELIMEKVVQESKILKQQAEDNAMLQEFLVDRGRVVDTLQGEIAVICQDVRLLKEKFDEHVPFSKSLSSSQTSCILASSSSSLKSSTREQVEPVYDGADSLETQNKTGSISSSDENSSENEAARDDMKALLDDGWELFDNREVYA